MSSFVTVSGRRLRETIATCDFCQEEFTYGWNGKERKFCDDHKLQSNRRREYTYICAGCGIEETSVSTAGPRTYCPACRPRRASSDEFKSEITFSCSDCKVEVTYFGKPGQPRKYCESCSERRNRESIAEWQFRVRDSSSSEYADLLEQQDGVCATCGEEPTGERLCIDHDHNTGEIRGLLCRGCNWTLGLHESGYRPNEVKFGEYLRRAK